jgi:hypothetical protein
VDKKRRRGRRHFPRAGSLLDLRLGTQFGDELLNLLLLQALGNCGLIWSNGGGVSGRLSSTRIT